jgi:DNA-binding SARP family transcriptional activator
MAAEDTGDQAAVALLAAAERRLNPAAAGPEPPPQRLAALTLGPFHLYQDGRPVEAWHGTRGPRIARYLLAHRRHPVPRERLMELIWPDTDPEVGRRNLHQAVYSLRRTLRVRQPDLQHIVFENDCYLLNPGIEVWCDSDAFEARVDEGDRLGAEGRAADAAAAYARAELLYRGEYLEDTPFEEWTVPTREYLAARHAEAMHHLARHNLELGRVDEAIACARRLLVRQTADEVAHQLIIRGQLAAGRRGDALRQYRACAQALVREYGFGPSSETSALCEPLRRVGKRRPRPFPPNAT